MAVCDAGVVCEAGEHAARPEIAAKANAKGVSLVVKCLNCVFIKFPCAFHLRLFVKDACFLKSFAPRDVAKFYYSISHLPLFNSYSFDKCCAVYPAGYKVDNRCAFSDSLSNHCFRDVFTASNRSTNICLLLCDLTFA